MLGDAKIEENELEKIYNTLIGILKMTTYGSRNQLLYHL